MRAVVGLLTLVSATTVPVRAAAQQPQERADSLELEMRALKARVDSLEQTLERLMGQRRDTVPPRDELAALRAAARAAVRVDTTAQTEAAKEPQFVSRTRNLNRLNPEISVTGDVRFEAGSPELARDNVDVREFEFSFQAALDPYTSTKVFLAFEDGAIDLEEAYAYWTGLPGGLRVDVGRLRQQIGELNRWHLHALPESEYPLVLTEYLGEEGLIGNGLGVYWIAPVSGPGQGTHELWGQVTLGDNEVLFDGGNRLSLLGHLNNFWQISRSTFFQIGATGLYGRNPDAALETWLYGADFRLTWRPPARALYRSFTLRGEGYVVEREVSGVRGTVSGGYVGAQYQLSRRLFLGSRFDSVEPIAAPGDRVWAIVPSIKWWQSEWLYLSAEWQHLSVPVAGIRDTSDRLVVQVVWAIGPHKHETY